MWERLKVWKFFFRNAFHCVCIFRGFLLAPEFRSCRKSFSPWTRLYELFGHFQAMWLLKALCFGVFNRFLSFFCCVRVIFHVKWLVTFESCISIQYNTIFHEVVLILCGSFNSSELWERSIQCIVYTNVPLRRTFGKRLFTQEKPHSNRTFQRRYDFVYLKLIIRHFEYSFGYNDLFFSWSLCIFRSAGKRTVALFHVGLFTFISSDIPDESHFNAVILQMWIELRKQHRKKAFH